MFGFVKKLFLGASFAALCAAPAHANIATVASVNEYIAQRLDITMPETNAHGVLDMSYLMTMIDKANEILNGAKVTEYAHDTELATTKIVSTATVDNAVENLIVKYYDPQFWFEPALTGNTFEIYISARGNYTVYWGDGQVTHIKKPNTTGQTYSHTYKDGKNASEHQIGLGGESYAYSTVDTTPVIGFNAATRRIKSFDGCLGCIFPTIDNGGDGNQPRFYQTFYQNTKLVGEIPAGLFNGVRGAPVSSMFRLTFGNTAVSGEIPADLFSGISGAPANDMFRSTFFGCTGLTGEIPAGLFSGISGAPAENMFWSTFNGCTGLTGEIPSDLFSGISGAPAAGMFFGTFVLCKSLTSIGDGLFKDIEGDAAKSMFSVTFANCSSLRGPSATVGTGENKQYLYERWPEADTSNPEFSAEKCYTSSTGLSDFNNIPSPYWK